MSLSSRDSLVRRLECIAASLSGLQWMRRVIVEATYLWTILDVPSGGDVNRHDG
jgi:hypothetical protein